MNYHEPVLLEESVNGLNIKPSGTYVDTTFGGGGHSIAILNRLKKGKILAFDQDIDAKNNLPDDNRILFINGNFRFIGNYLRYYKTGPVDGILADLGVSSHHFDEAERGFSYRFDGALDMRMNRKSDFTAEKLVNTYSEDNLVRVFWEFGEITNSRKLAFEIIRFRKKQKIEKSSQLIEVIFSCIPKKIENKYLAKVFQALRIEVNQEIRNLKDLLNQSTDILKPGGRIAIISYHSLEDRVVKNFFRWGNFSEGIMKDIYGNTNLPLRLINKKHISPGEIEIEKNSRARSAKLRIAEKI